MNQRALQSASFPQLSHLLNQHKSDLSQLKHTIHLAFRALDWQISHLTAISEAEKTQQQEELRQKALKWKAQLVISVDILMMQFEEGVEELEKREKGKEGKENREKERQGEEDNGNQTW